MDFGARRTGERAAEFEAARAEFLRRDEPAFLTWRKNDYRLRYSRRNNCIGSTEAARRAGSHDASADDATRVAMAAEITSQSNGFTSNSKLAAMRVTSADKARPMTIPNTVSESAVANTFRTTLSRLAPTAMRIAISRLRSVTA